MATWAYYNENDDFAAQWLDLLIINGLIAPGFVDRRSIVDVKADDLKEFIQCHFFAGIGGWSLACRLAGVPDDYPLWSGSCPCQPFSNSGKQKGEADARHLWPEFRRIIKSADDAERGPAILFGEQVASPLGRIWLARVRSDLEKLGYAVGAADLCSACLGAPHMRQRLNWVANRIGGRKQRPALRGGPFRAGDGFIDCSWMGFPHGAGSQPGLAAAASVGQGDTADAASPVHSRVADAERDAREQGRPASQPGEGAGAPAAGTRTQPGRRGVLRGGVGDTDDTGSQGRSIDAGERRDQFTPWQASVAIPCSDERYRRVPAGETGELEPALFPLAHGVPNRVGTLRGSGNAINPWLTAEFIKASIEAIG